ncbi:MAG: phosphatase PAP2 family protein [Butyrivibrio sp.]|nr:phosphatase PAP2 family protein [Butyrivibrio sp.]
MIELGLVEVAVAGGIMDIEYLLFLQNNRESMGGVMDGFMLFVTSLAESKATFLLLGIIYWCVDKRAGRFMGMNVSLSCLLSQMLKGVFCVERPWVRSEAVHPVEAAIPAATGYSFPSGHTTRATATWGSLGFYEIKKREAGKDVRVADKLMHDSIRKIFGYLMFLFIFLMGFSRNYLGVHTPQDVAVAFTYSVAMWFVSYKLLDWVDSTKNGDVVLLIVYVAVAALWTSFIGSVTNAGAGIAYLLSLVLDRRVVHFEIPDRAWARIVVAAIGGAGFWFLIDNVSKVLSPICGNYTGIVVSFCYMFYVMTVVPVVTTLIDVGRKYA